MQRKLRQLYFGLTFAPWPCVLPDFFTGWTSSDCVWYVSGAMVTIFSIMGISTYALVVGL